MECASSYSMQSLKDDMMENGNDLVQKYKAA